MKSIFQLFCLLPMMWSATVVKAQERKSAADNYFEISKNLEIITNVYKELNDYYVNPIEPGKMLKTSLDAMLKELDPYTVFISESEIEDMQLLSAGQYGGIGVSLFKHPNGAFVFEQPLQNGPANKAGIRSGDILRKIDNKDITQLSLEQIGLLFRGAPNTAIAIEVVHPITQQSSIKKIIRDNIQIPTVQYAQLIGAKKDIAYVNLGQFTPDCTKMVRTKLDSLKAANNGSLSGLVLDLRNNPGGLLDEAVNMCNLFVEKGQIIVTTKGNTEEWDKTFATMNSPWDKEIPLTILINSQSASASEIVAGSLQDLDRAVVIGQRSYGKGLVQVIKNIGYNAKLKITTAKYYTAAGRCIQSLDYTHKNPDGSVHSVPDSLKQHFKTKKGRDVYDGGGIDPDINIGYGKNTTLMTSLLINKLLFDYATLYCHQNKTIGAPHEYYFSNEDFNEFKKWLPKQKVGFQTDADKKLKDMQLLIAQELKDSAIDATMKTLEQQMEQYKMKEVEANKREIISLLNKEIVTRYYFSVGAIENSIVKDDLAISEALSVIEEKKFQTILK